MDSSRQYMLSDIKESRGSESSDQRAPNQSIDIAREASDETSFEPVRMVNVSVRERVIFCIDAHFHKPVLQQSVYAFINNYMELKRRIAVKEVDFGILLMTDHSNKYVPVPSKKHVNNVMVAMSELQIEEDNAFDFSLVFNYLADMVQLPDPALHGENIPPPHVYHFIIIFGRNRFIPTIQSTNAYNYLIENPFVALDLLYLHNNEVTRNKTKKISTALRGLVDETKGFYEVCSARNVAGYSRALNRFLGHPLIRFPQKSAVFDLARLPAIYNN